jgi:uncharacterized protein
VSTKVIKDSVHGYISIDDDFIKIVDSAEFQRLKWVEQGSFRVLYPAARHDRFIHSLGTYHLATTFANNFISNIQSDIRIDITKEELEKIRKTFLYAALLHDIGHAPFSHTCENFFRIKSSPSPEIGNAKIDNDLLISIREIPNKEKAEVDRFKDEYKKDINPSEHEIVSATILIRDANKFEVDNSKIDLELAARMVIGCTYMYNPREENTDILGIKNCFIRLLNSDAVDVDKLDYITRDTRMSGFSNVPIDIQRLSKSVTAVRTSDGYIYPAFHKNVLSVIDNVFRAKTEQSLWMVSHPVVTYDSKLLHSCISSLGTDYIETVFSSDAISSIGCYYKDKKYILLSDMDIISDLKALYDKSPLVHEFFERSTRRHPIWKSCYEFRYIFGNESENVFIFFKAAIELYNEKLYVINDELLSRLPPDSPAIPALNLLKLFATECNILFDFVILQGSNGFAKKIDPEKINIRFDKLPNRVGSNVNFAQYSVLKGQDNSHMTGRFFYLYSPIRINAESIERLRSLISDATSRIPRA